MLYIHETADKVMYYPESYLILFFVEGYFSIEKVNENEFSFRTPQAFLKIQNLEGCSIVSLKVPIFKNTTKPECEVELGNMLKGIKKAHFKECSQELILHYKNTIISISGKTRKKEYFFDKSEIIFNAELIKFVERHSEEWLKSKRIKLGEHAALNILINLAVNQDLKEANSANHE